VYVALKRPGCWSRKDGKKCKSAAGREPTGTGEKSRQAGEYELAEVAEESRDIRGYELSLCLIKQASHHEDVPGSRGISPPFLLLALTYCVMKQFCSVQYIIVTLWLINK
jgi:hypothetical protein